MRTSYVAFASVFFWNLVIQSSFASLGDTKTSIQKDQKALKGKRGKVLSRTDYSVHEIALKERVVKEYVLSNGTVFAVSWQGVSQPDLSVLLGQFYEEYEQASLRQNQQSGIKEQ